MLLQLFAKNSPKLLPSFFPCHNDGFFRKPTSPPLPLREGPPLISVFSPQGRRENRSSSSLVTISFYGWRTIRGLRQQQSCGLRYATAWTKENEMDAESPKSPQQHALMPMKPIATRPEGAEALSPGQRPGYTGNGQGALNQRSPAHSGKVKGKSFKIHLTQLSQIGKFKKLKPYALQLNIQTIRLLS